MIQAKAKSWTSVEALVQPICEGRPVVLSAALRLVNLRRLLQELQDSLRHLIGLRKSRNAGLAEDLLPGQI